jgi:predicted DsbA family dithiol-disulfide isomerase
VTVLDVELFTDPACPFAFSAEPVRQRLRWHYGNQLRWTTRMIVLTREPGEADRLAEGAPGLQGRYGMPIDPRPYPRPASSEPACRAVVAVRLNAPELTDTLLRRLRVRVMQAGLLDDPGLIAAAAGDAGLNPTELASWSHHAAVRAALEADAAAAREPTPAARALDHKLGGPAGRRRYTAPSYIIDGYAVPGFNPVEAYETAIANRAPQLARRPRPESVRELLEWADEPLATAEIALVMQSSRDEVREALTSFAAWQPAGADGYWTLPDRAATAMTRSRVSAGRCR